MDLDTGSCLGAGAVVLLHTLPPGLQGVRSEEAVFRQYNSCVDFTFQERRGNASELTRAGGRRGRHPIFLKEKLGLDRFSINF